MSQRAEIFGRSAPGDQPRSLRMREQLLVDRVRAAAERLERGTRLHRLELGKKRGLRDRAR